MRLRTLVCGSRLFDFVVCRIHIIMSLRLAFNAVRFIQSGIKPLWTIRHARLVEDAVHQFVVENLGIFLTGKIIILVSPYFPAVGHTMGNLFYGSFSSGTTAGLRNAGFSEVLLCQAIRSNLAPVLWYFHIVHFQNNFTRRVSDYRTAIIVFKLIEYVLIAAGKTAFKP